MAADDGTQQERRSSYSNEYFVSSSTRSPRCFSLLMARKTRMRHVQSVGNHNPHEMIAMARSAHNVENSARSISATEVVLKKKTQQPKNKKNSSKSPDSNVHPEGKRNRVRPIYRFGEN